MTTISIDDIYEEAVKCFGADLSQPLAIMDGNGDDKELNDISCIVVDDESQMWLTYYAPIIVKMLVDATAKVQELEAHIESLKADNERVRYAVRFNYDGVWRPLEEFYTLNQAQAFVAKSKQEKTFSKPLYQIVRQEVIE